MNEAAKLESSPWISFLRFYTSVKGSLNEHAEQYLHEIFLSKHPDAPALVDLCCSVALTGEQYNVAITALRYRIKGFFDHHENISNVDDGLKILAAIRALTRLVLKRSQNTGKHFT